jgi:AcrR family transcriptional regulator
MVRPRFQKLEAAQQRAILNAAAEEFTRHGFAGASLNRIIETAGISKGSMYYYFDDKEELYADVVRIELTKLLDEAGPFPVPADRDPEAYWLTLEQYYLRLMDALAASPRAAALARDWLLVSGSTALQKAQKDMERGASPWFEETLAAGQRVRAVRKDLPIDLLVAVAFGMGQAVDAWLITKELGDKTRRKHLRTLVGMIRSAFSP